MHPSKLVGLYRIKNAHQESIKEKKFVHCFSAEIIKFDGKIFTIQFNSFLDSRDYPNLGHTVDIPLDEFNESLSKYLVKI